MYEFVIYQRNDSTYGTENVYITEGICICQTKYRKNDKKQLHIENRFLMEPYCLLYYIHLLILQKLFYQIGKWAFMKKRQKPSSVLNYFGLYFYQKTYLLAASGLILSTTLITVISAAAEIHYATISIISSFH